VSNIIYHDFTTQKEKPTSYDVLLESGDLVSFVPEDTDDLADLFNIEYFVQPCLFGWEAIMINSMRYTTYSLPNFYKTETAAEAAAETHRISELTKIDAIFDEMLDDWDE